MRADAQPQLVLARAGAVRPRYRVLQLHGGAERRVGGRECEECPIAGGIGDATCMPTEAFAQQVDVQLLELPARRVAIACEILGRADDVGEDKCGVALETAHELALQLVLQADDLRHAERAEILHAESPYRSVAALTTRYTARARCVALPISGGGI